MAEGGQVAVQADDEVVAASAQRVERWIDGTH